MKTMIPVLLSSLLVLLFCYTAMMKLLDPVQFRADLNAQVFPKALVPFLFYSIPVIELAIAACLLFDRTRLPALWASLVLMLLFTAYTALVLARVFHKVPCSCGGVISRLNWKQHLVFNIFFVFVSGTAIKLCMHAKQGNRNPAQKRRDIT